MNMPENILQFLTVIIDTLHPAFLYGNIRSFKTGWQNEGIKGGQKICVVFSSAD